MQLADNAWQPLPRKLHDRSTRETAPSAYALCRLHGGAHAGGSTCSGRLHSGGSERQQGPSRQLPHAGRCCDSCSGRAAVGHGLARHLAHRAVRRLLSHCALRLADMAAHMMLQDRQHCALLHTCAKQGSC